MCDLFVTTRHYRVNNLRSFHWVEVRELLYSLVTGKYEQENLDLYQDDGLAVLENISGLVSEKIKIFL